MTVEEMKLSSVAESAAKDLMKKYPKLKFTSGKRSVTEQASAMASNIVSSKNRNWIADTYISSTPVAKLQKWVTDNPAAVTAEKIRTGLETIMNSMAEGELSQVSKHLSGEAFDVEPVVDDADAIKDYIKKLTGITKFLDKEGGLVRWHAQF